MNDKELNKNVKKSLENFIKELATNPEKVFDNNKLQIKYNKVLKEKIKLQSNWNSLRELLINEKKLIEEDEFFCNLSNKDYIEFILDKMNELEGKDKE